MKKRGAAALLAAICLLAGCAASDPALPAETPTPTETSSPAYQGDSLFAYCTEKQRELLELPHEELPVFCARTCRFTAATRCSRGKQGNILNERSCLVGDIVDVKINQQATQPSAAYQACPRPE